MSRNVRIVVAGILGALLLIFVFQNTEIVSVRFLVWDFSMSRVILVLLTTVVGFVCGLVVAKLFGLPRRSRG